MRVLDAGAENGAKPFSMTKKAFWLGGDAALRFVAGRTYDAAFSYGEWCPLEFVAQNVAARTKSVWIHTDITKSNGFDANAFFDSFLSYRYYIFVSEDTKRRAEARYPFLIGKSALIHNVLDRAWLEKQAAQPVKDFAYPVWGLHLITVANVRTEKGYPRMLETAKALKARKVEFTWLCVGAQPDAALLERLKREIAQSGLNGQMILLGPRANPYPYMRAAQVFVLLSDYEAWPLAMAEAMMLGRPAVATRTSGACTHIVDGQNGLLCDFSAESAADALQRCAEDENLMRTIRCGAARFDPAPEALREFHEFIAHCMKFNSET